MDFTPLLKTLSRFFPSSPLSKKKSLPLSVFIISPHPDDESISGSLAFRLAYENGAKVINVAMTLGSDKRRQEERKRELNKACKVLKISNTVLSDDWKKKKSELKTLIKKHSPDLIIAPHAKDFHPTHIKSSLLLQKTLKDCGKLRCLIAWSEFWSPLSKPNIMVEVPEVILKLQMEALCQHVGEIKRNPYHLRLPAWMMDNVRRGSEIISGKGSEAVNIPYAVLYQLQLFKNGELHKIKVSPFITNQSDIGQIFKLILDAASGSKTKVK